MIAPRNDGRQYWKLPSVLSPAGDERCRNGRVLVEIGPGRGDFLFHLAANNPDAHVCGIEIKRKRFLKLIKQRDRLGLSNISLILGDARDVLGDDPGSRVPSHGSRVPGQVDAIFILFPDPWPKRRHKWHRLLNTEFLALCSRILRTSGEIFCATDHRPYAEEVENTVAGLTGWSRSDGGKNMTDDADLFPTFFATKWRSEGRTIYRQRYVRNV